MVRFVEPRPDGLAAVPILPGKPDCSADLSLAIDALAQRYPDDRMALLSSLQDSTISLFTDQSPASFETALLQLVDERIEPLTNTRAFLIPGDHHGLFEDFAAYASGGVALPDWLGQMLDDDPTWSTLGR